MILLDTHIWVRWLTGEADPLPATIVQQVDAAQTLAVSVISWWEVAMLVKRGRLTLPLPLADWCFEATVNSGIECLPLTPAIALRSVQLADIHRDPADRFIMATAIEHQASLISLDNAIAAYPEMQGILVVA